MCTVVGNSVQLLVIVCIYLCCLQFGCMQPFCSGSFCNTCANHGEHHCKSQHIKFYAAVLATGCYAMYMNVIL